MPITKLRSPAAAARWLSSWVGGTITTDSRRVRPGDGFIAWPGAAHDGRRFVEAALAAGATTCLVEEEGVEAFGFADARVAALGGLKAATGPIAAEFFGQPAERLAVVATTGTNGKTSTAWWTAQALAALPSGGRPAAVAGTLGLGEPPRLDGRAVDFPVEATGLTTPDPVRLHAALRRFADGGVQALALEASSIGLVEQRLAGLKIDVALFTNFTRDHLDYHGTMDAYWAAKRSLFAWPGLKAAVVNVDDPQGAAVAAELQAEVDAGRALDLWTVSLQHPARLQAAGLRQASEGLAFAIAEGGSPAVELQTRLVGDYNASNLLVVAAGLRALGVPLAEAAATLARVTPVPGRLQRVQVEGAGWRAGAAALPEVVVDYAHTPDALEQVLRALRPLARTRGGRLVCVFGCGGNRDATKRPLMGAIAARGADRVVLTSDNPRHESPGFILAQILAGTAGRDDVAVVEDRREAIASTVAEAAAEDVVLLAGKGHEDYQEVAGVRHPFSDEAEARAALERRLERVA